jgi:hypothetical protein
MIVVSASVTTVNATVEPTSVLVTLPTQVITINAGIPGPPGRDGIDGGSLLWQVVTEGQVLEVGHGYQYDGLALGIFTLPLSPSNGDRIALYRIGSANWQLQENEGQFIFVIATATTPSTGYVQSLEPGGAIELAYTGGGRWECTDIIGNIEVI